jgi:hypothetical protein
VVAVRFAALAVALCALLAVPTVAGAATPKPKTGKSVVVNRAKGAVFVTKRGSSKRVRLGSKAMSVPVGSTIDASRGTARLTSTHNRSGSKLQSADFYDGAFTVSQNKASAPLTELTLKGGDFNGCQAGAKGKSNVFAARARRRLWGRGKGRFRTRGRNGTATVRGTTWLTEDLCEGTMATSRSGEVETNAIDANLARLLEPGQSVIYSCNTDGVPGVSQLYCLVVLSQPARSDQPFDLVGFGIASFGTPQDSYTLCINGTDCGEFPFKADQLDDGTPIKVGGVGCIPATPGNYSVAWSIAGSALPPALPYTAKTPSGTSGCVSDPPRPGIDPPASSKFSPQQLRKLRAAAGIGQ